MTGFFRRIAQRAMGAATTVHAVARLPYAPQPGLAEVPVVVPASSFAARRAEAEGKPVLPARKPQQLRGVAQARDEPFHPEMALRPSAADDGKDLRVADSQAERLPRGPPLPETLVAASPLPTSREAGEVAPAPSTEREPRDVRHANLKRAAPLLLPQQASFRVQSRNAFSPRAARGRSEPAAFEETEVQVSIGRIEVTAVHEAPPPKRSAQPVPRAMSLEEYLARRRGGRS